MDRNKKNELRGTTPVPNVLFDEYLPKLNPTELKLLFVVVRQTLGWRDPRTGKQKTKDWLSGSQLRRRTGCSRRALTDATASLIKKKLIQVSGETDTQLKTAEQRKGKLRMFYRFIRPEEKPVEKGKVKEKIAQQAAQKLHTTKDNRTKGKTETYRFTENDIQRFQTELKKAGSIEQLLRDKEAIKIQKGEREITVHDNPETYRETHMREYSLPGLKKEQLRVPYSLWMTLYHRTKGKNDRNRTTRNDI